jgi:hypothetical protein
MLLTFAITFATAVGVKAETLNDAQKTDIAAFCKKNCPNSCYVVCGGPPQCAPTANEAIAGVLGGICGSGFIMNNSKLFGIQGIE